MVWRVVTYLLFLAGGGLLGWLEFSPFRGMTGVALGVAGGGFLWLMLDLSRGVRLLRWLRLGAGADLVFRTGLWGEVSERVRRLVRNRELQVRDSEHRLQDFLAAFQASPNGVVLLDAHQQIEWFNQIAATHFGLQPERDMLQHFSNLVRDPGFASYLASRHYDSQLVMPGRQSTSSRPVKLSVQLHPYGEGRLLLLSRDVTAVELAETMRRDFVANVSHEIRTPLTVLSGFVETLQTLSLDDEQRARYLGLMATQAQRMQTLVSDLLTLSRLEGSPPPSASEWVSLPVMMAELEKEAHNLSAVLSSSSKSAHRLTFGSEARIELAGAPSELQSAMSNLVGNAIRYTPQGGDIRVVAHVLPDGRAEFAVSDTGLGISEDHIPRLTERFYRVDRSRSRDTGGTGLGLAIVKHVSQRHGADFRIESQPGEGSTFSMVFPASRIRPCAASNPARP